MMNNIVIPDNLLKNEDMANLQHVNEGRKYYLFLDMLIVQV